MRCFLHDESGAVTVDWTVLTAAIVGLGISSVAAVRTGVLALGQDVEASLTNATVAQIMAEIGGFDASNTNGLQTTPWGWVATGSHDGWFTIGPNTQIEISRSGQRVTTPDGGNWIDLEYYAGNVTLARSFDTMQAGQSYTLNFNAADSAGNNGVDIYFGGQLVQSVDPASRNFTPYSVTLQGGSGDGSNQLEFRGTGPQDSVGVSLHAIEVR